MQKWLGKGLWVGAAHPPGHLLPIQPLEALTCWPWGWGQGPCWGCEWSDSHLDIPLLECRGHGAREASSSQDHCGVFLDLCSSSPFFFFLHFDFDFLAAVVVVVVFTSSSLTTT